MAYYYVKSGGTATGDAGREATTPRTGSFASMGAANYYPSVDATLSVATTIAIEGDRVHVADDHNHEYTADTYISPGSGSGLDPLVILSVDVNNCDQYKPGAVEHCGTVTAWDISFSQMISMYGCTFRAGGDLIFNMANDYFYAEDCSFESGSVGTRGIDCGVESILTWVNCDATLCSGGIAFDRTCLFRWYGGTVSVSLNGLTQIINLQGDADQVHLYGVDLSAHSGDLIRTFTSVSSSFQAASLTNCKVNASSDILSIAAQTAMTNGTTVTVTGCGATSASAEYQYEHFDRYGTVLEETSIYRTGSAEWASGAQTSLKVVTLTDPKLSVPFTFALPTRYAALSSTATDVLTIHLVSSTALTDGDVWVQCQYPDGTNKHQQNRITTHTADVLATGAALATSTEAWTNPPATPNYYKIEIDTSIDVGADGIPKLTMFVAKPSVTFYVCPTVELS